MIKTGKIDTTSAILFMLTFYKTNLFSLKVIYLYICFILYSKHTVEWLFSVLF